MLFVLIFTIVACNKPNPNPELADEIYSDLKSSAEASEKDVESEKKKLEAAKKELEAVVPQTGEIKYAQKRFFESEAKLQRLEQVQKYYALKAEARLKYTKLEYLKAFKAGKPWPTEEEIESYRTYKLLSQKEPSWDSRKRVQAYEKENGIESSAKPKAEGEKKAETKPAEH